MQDDKNKLLPVMDILKNAYLTIYTNIKSLIIFSYLLAVPIYLISQFLTMPTAETATVSYFTIAAYVLISLLILAITNIYFYRLFTLGNENVLKITPDKLFSLSTSMVAYLLALFGILFIALVTVSLIIGVIVSVVNELLGPGRSALTSAAANLIILIVMLLINMRLQPTFISIAINEQTLPMKSAYYYTRDNNRELILIGLFSFIPALLPSTVALIFVNNLSLSQNAVVISDFLLFPLLLLPNIVLLSAGVQIYNYLVPKNKPHMDIQV